jgi:hypothetical protein
MISYKSIIVVLLFIAINSKGAIQVNIDILKLGVEIEISGEKKIHALDLMFGGLNLGEPTSAK